MGEWEESALETASPATPPEADRLVIYNGSLILQVPEPEEVEKNITALAKDLHGWVQRIDGLRITVRVPAPRFDDAFAQIALWGQVVARRVTGNDVTDPFRDLKIRLENSERLRARLAAILEQAKTVMDALAVEKELARVTEEIERLKGALAQMQDQISYSTLSVELVRSMPSRPGAPGFPFRWVRELGVGRLLEFGR
jgi:hypothetical protein